MGLYIIISHSHFSFDLQMHFKTMIVVDAVSMRRSLAFAVVSKGKTDVFDVRLIVILSRE